MKLEDVDSVLYQNMRKHKQNSRVENCGGVNFEKLRKCFDQSLGAFQSVSKGATTQNEGKFPLFPAEVLVTEFGLDKSAVCHWLCWLESLSTVPFVHYHHHDEDEADHGEEGQESREKDAEEEPMQVVALLNEDIEVKGCDPDANIEPVTHIWNVCHRHLAPRFKVPTVSTWVWEPTSWPVEAFLMSSVGHSLHILHILHFRWLTSKAWTSRTSKIIR